METLAVLAPLMLAHLAAAISPGPSFVLIARTAAARSRGAAMRMAVGLGLGAVVWAAAALFGMSLLFEIAPGALAALRVAGGLFLVWLAWQLWRHAPEPAVATGTAGPTTGDVRRGFLVQLANPKVSIFFGSVFLAIFPAGAGAGVEALPLAAIMAVETGWYLAVAAAFATPSVRLRYLRLKTAIDRTCAGVLGLLGVRLATA